MDKNAKLNVLNNTFNMLVGQGRIRTKGEFAHLLGVNRSTLSSAFNGDEQYLTPSLIAKVVKTATDMKDGGVDETEGGSLLVIPTAAMAGTLGDFADSIQAYQCERMVSPIKGADYALSVTGDSMSPEYPSGSQIIIKKVDESIFVEWGKVYVLDTNNGAVIKQIRKTDKPDVVECVSLNPAYQPFVINTKDIHGWYRVLMCLSMK